MPKNHEQYLWNKDRFINWSLTIGTNTNIAIEKMFDRCKVEEQAYAGPCCRMCCAF